MFTPPAAILLAALGGASFSASSDMRSGSITRHGNSGYRHGLRASELCDLQWHQVELNAGRLHVRRSPRCW